MRQSRSTGLVAKAKTEQLGFKKWWGSPPSPAPHRLRVNFSLIRLRKNPGHRAKIFWGFGFEKSPPLEMGGVITFDYFLSDVAGIGATTGFSVLGGSQMMSQLGRDFLRSAMPWGVTLVPVRFTNFKRFLVAKCRRPSLVTAAKRSRERAEEIAN